MTDSYSVQRDPSLFQEPGCIIQMRDMGHRTVGWIANPKINDPQELADEVSRVIAEHNELAGKLTGALGVLAEVEWIEVLDSEGREMYRRCPGCGGTIGSDWGEGHFHACQLKKLLEVAHD